MRLVHWIYGAGCLSLLTLSIGCAAPTFKTALKMPGSKSTVSKPLNPIAAKKQQDLVMRFDMAQVREQEGELLKARQLYEELIVADPKNGDYHHRLGVVQCREGKFDKGLESLRTADSLKPDQPEILNDLGYATMMVGKFDLAEQVFLTVLDLNPQDERAINNLGLSLGMAGRFDESYSAFRRVMPESQALTNLGYVSTQAGNCEFAVDCYSRALKLDPTNRKAAEAMTQLADLRRQIDQRKAIAKASQPSATINQASFEAKAAQQTIR